MRLTNRTDSVSYIYLAMNTSLFTKITKNKQITLKSFGDSMLPQIRDGDIIQIKTIPPRDLKIDDIVCYLKNKHFITHRVVYIDQNRRFVITKGDNNLSADKRISFNKILGRVSTVTRSNQTYPIETLYLMQSTIYYQEVLLISSRFTAQKINFVFLKGLPVYLHYSKKHPDRLYADIDILIPNESFFQVGQLLTKMGYIRQSTNLFRWQPMLKISPAEVSFQKMINGIPVVIDLHLQANFLMTQFSSDFLYPLHLLKQFSTELLSNKTFLKLGNHLVPILKHDYLVLYLLLHLFHDNFHGYKNYTLLHTLIRSQRADFLLIKKTSSKYLLNSFLNYSLAYFGKVYPADIALNEFIAIDKKITLENLMSQQTRMDAGIVRFIGILKASPLPLAKKCGFFFTPTCWFFIISIGFLLIKRRVKFFAF